MTITYRTLKGAPLSADELDQNFRELHQRLEVLEGAKGGGTVQRASAIATVRQEGCNIIFEAPSGEAMGSVKLPLIHFRPRGHWEARQDYAFYDLCIDQGKTYICKRAHKSGASFEVDPHWALLFTAH